MPLLSVGSSFFPGTKAVGSVAWVNGAVLVLGSNPGKLSRHRPGEAAAVVQQAEIDLPTDAPSGIASSGTELFLGERRKRHLFVLDDNFRVVRTVNFTDIDWGSAPLVWRAEDSEITDLTWGGGKLWMACKAGMSSTVFCVGVAETGLKVEGRFRARGTNPVGLAFDLKANCLWTLDGHARALRPSKPSGEPVDEQYLIPATVKEPSGLAVDPAGFFWTADASTGTVHQLRR